MRISQGQTHILDVMVQRRQQKRRSSGRSGSARSHWKRRPDPALSAKRKEVRNHLQASSRALSAAAIQCLDAYMSEERDAIVDSSVTYLITLCDIWGTRNLDVPDIWREVDGRMQISALLDRLSQRRSSAARLQRKMWHPSSTKLP